jgi:spermidine/putrescine transport system ATP-binding protein
MLDVMLQLVNIGKSFSNQVALASINLQIQNGEFFSLLGPSGCGKSTLLRLVGGLETPTQGQILLDGESIVNIPAQKRPFNLVFQRYALFPHLNVFENVAYGLRIKRTSAPERLQRVQQVLSLVDMGEFAQRLPETLSGGQAQRVAIARALVNQPRVLLLDEPLSALDQKLREHMQRELRALQKKLGITFIYVTHDHEEALNLSDRIGIMSRGNLEHVGRPEDVYYEPDSSFSRHFTGGMSCLKGELVEVSQGLVVVRVADGTLVRGHSQLPPDRMRPGMKLNVFVRRALAMEDNSR